MLFYMFQGGREATRLLLLGSLRGSGYFFLPRWEAFSLTELTDLTEPFCALFNSRGVFSLTDLTDLTEPFGARFEPTEGLRHTEFTERYC